MSRGEEKASCKVVKLSDRLEKEVKEYCSQRKVIQPIAKSTLWLDLAGQLIDVSRTTLSKMLAGDEVTASVLTRVATKIGIPLMDLIERPRDHRLPLAEWLREPNKRPKESIDSGRYSRFRYGYFINDNRLEAGEPGVVWFRETAQLIAKPVDVDKAVRLGGEVENEQGMRWRVEGELLGEFLLVLMAKYVEEGKEAKPQQDAPEEEETPEPVVPLWKYFSMTFTGCYPLKKKKGGAGELLCGSWSGFNAFGTPTVRRMFLSTRELDLTDLAALADEHKIKLFLEAQAMFQPPK